MLLGNQFAYAVARYAQPQKQGCTSRKIAERRTYYIKRLSLVAGVIEMRWRVEVIRGDCTGDEQQTPARRYHALFLYLADLPPPQGPFLFVLLRAKPCRSFRRHAFANVGEHERPGSAEYLARERKENKAGKSVRTYVAHLMPTACFTVAEIHRALMTLPGNATRVR